MLARLRARLGAVAAVAAPVGDAVVLAALGALVRAAVVSWAAKRFPPVEDARFYHELGTRLARGLGYTWQWPDGAVTFVAHYPVGYPGLLGAGYALFGAQPVVGMTLNALLGALAVLAVHRIAAASVGRLGAGLSGLVAALHPALVLYTPALMTEGVTASLLTVAGWLAVIARRSSRPLGWWLLLGGVFGLATLVRGQSLLIAPLFGLIAGSGRARRGMVWGALAVTLSSACVFLPWTLRNCEKMDRCVVVSANVGWNLLIGATDGATGTFVPIAGPSVPEACRSVFGEAEKDACFAKAAGELVRARPLRWLALAPAKLASTFEYCGAAGWYLGASGPGSFSERDKLTLGVIETGLQRGLLALAHLGIARVRGPRRGARVALALFGIAALFAPFAWVSALGLVASCLLLGGRLLEHPALGLGASAILMTAATHAVFFGAGRYSLVVFPLVAAMAGLGLAARRGDGSPAF